LTLGYWNIRGIHRGNVTRYLLAYSQANWEEKTYTIMSGDWQQVKPDLMDFPNLPYLVDGDFKISETFAVHVYIAQKFCPSLYGTTPQEQARVTQLNRIGDENFMNFIKMCFQDGNDKAGVTAKCMDGLAPLGNLLNDDRPFLRGHTPCIADFILFEHINYANHLSENQTYARYPKLEAFHTRVANLPNFK